MSLLIADCPHLFLIVDGHLLQGDVEPGGEQHTVPLYNITQAEVGVDILPDTCSSLGLHTAWGYIQLGVTYSLGLHTAWEYIQLGVIYN